MRLLEALLVKARSWQKWEISRKWGIWPQFSMRLQNIQIRSPFSPFSPTSQKSLLWWPSKNMIILNQIFLTSIGSHFSSGMGLPYSRASHAQADAQTLAQPPSRGHLYSGYSWLGPNSVPWIEVPLCLFLSLRKVTFTITNDNCPQSSTKKWI